MKKFTEAHLHVWDNEQNEYVWSLNDTWNNSTPEDFYFEILSSSEVDFSSDLERDKDIIYLFVTPANYFDENDYSWDQSMPIEHLFSPYEFEEEMEGMWSIEGKSKTVVENDFLQKGFRKNDKFSKICKDGSD